MKHSTSSAFSSSSPATAGGFSSFAPVEKSAVRIVAKTVVQERETGSVKQSRKDARRRRLALKAVSARLVYGFDEKLGKRISQCCYVNYSDVTLSRVTLPNGDVRGSFSGVVTCSNVWACPACTYRISEARRKEMNHLISWARGEGHKVVMLTLTARHNARTALAPFLDDLKGALRSLRQMNVVKNLAQVGSVTATEVTHGSSGFHPHVHILYVLDRSVSDPVAAVETLRAGWLRQIERRGLSGNSHAFQVQSAEQAGEYIAKFGAAEEMTLGHIKKGRGDASRSPWQILADAEGGCKQSAALWREYVAAFKGKRQLVWSRGLKALCGVNEVSDDDCEPDGERVVLRVWPAGSDPKYWRHARRRMCSLLDAVEDGTSLDLAEFGPADCVLWARERADSEVIE